MTPEGFITNLLTFAPWLLLKIISLILLLLHLAFSFVLLRQTRLMTRVVEAQITPAITTVSLIHLLSSLFVLFWIIIFL